MIIAVIYVTFVVAKRKPERKNNELIILLLILHFAVHIYDFHIFITSQLQLYYGICFENEGTNAQ